MSINSHHIKFNMYSNCTDITIPNNVSTRKSTLRYAFENMQNLKNITLGGGGY